MSVNESAAGPIDVTPLNEDPAAPCYDEGRHDFQRDGTYLRCRRGCGAEVSIEELKEDE